MEPFSLESKNDGLVLLQTFMAVETLTALILAAATIERRKGSNALRQRVDDLATLNDASKTFLDVIEITNIFQTICWLAVTRLGLDVAWIETRYKNDTGEKCQVIGYGAALATIQSLKEKWQGLNFSDLAACRHLRQAARGKCSVIVGLRLLLPANFAHPFWDRDQRTADYPDDFYS